MLTALLVLIYVSFISLGLPDALLGAAWPSIYWQLQVPVSYAGLLSMIIAGGTIVSSLLSGKLIRRLGTGKITLLSVFMTAAALFGFSCSRSFFMLCLCSVPYGLGAGAVDAALNNFVALHYKARHMSWLHCFWGVGASLGPSVMGYCLTRNLGWNSGYRFVFLLQAALCAVLFFSLPLWKKCSETQQGAEHALPALKINALLKKAGAKPALVAFFCYCGLETTTGLWGSSYLVVAKGLPADVAALWISLFYVGITAGRFVCGFISLKMKDKAMVRLGQGGALVGIAFLLAPLSGGFLCIGFVLLGMGCAPIFPSMLHATPHHFGKGASQAMMGIQMASAYAGSTLLPPFVGLVAERVSMHLYPLFLLALLCLMVLMTERLNKAKPNAEKEVL